MLDRPGALSTLGAPHFPMKKRILLPLVLACASVLHAEIVETDIVVFGGTAGGVSAACTVAKMGKKVEIGRASCRERVL